MENLVPYRTIAQMMDLALAEHKKPRKQHKVPTPRRLRLTRGGYHLRHGEGRRCQHCKSWTVNKGGICRICLDRAPDMKEPTPCN